MFVLMESARADFEAAQEIYEKKFNEFMSVMDFTDETTITPVIAARLLDQVKKMDKPIKQNMDPTDPGSLVDY